MDTEICAEEIENPLNIAGVEPQLLLLLNVLESGASKTCLHLVLSMRISARPGNPSLLLVTLVPFMEALTPSPAVAFLRHVLYPSSYTAVKLGS